MPKINRVNNIATTNEYKEFITDIKSKITKSQVKIASTVNSAFLVFYWELGKMISVKQKETKWGSKFIEQMANDLKKEFPSLKGFSRTNLFYIKKFYEFYSIDLVQLGVGLSQDDDKNQIVHHHGGLIESIVFQIPWRHNVEIFTKVNTINEAMYYVEQTIVNNWGRDPTIGIILCRDKNNIEVEFALRDINKPMGVSEFELTEILPNSLKSSLPTIEEIEEEFNK
jgi:predicted nuclease of restriction endonuclease-like (RecB) superfamily